VKGQPSKIIGELPKEIVSNIPKSIQKAFIDNGNLTLKTFKSLEDKTIVSKQFIQDLTNKGDIKQVERNLIREALAAEGDRVDVAEFAEKVRNELLPLKVESSRGCKKVERRRR